MLENVHEKDIFSTHTQAQKQPNTSHFHTNILTYPYQQRQLLACN